SGNSLGCVWCRLWILWDAVRRCRLRLYLGRSRGYFGLFGRIFQTILLGGSLKRFFCRLLREEPAGTESNDEPDYHGNYNQGGKQACRFLAWLGLGLA